MTERETELQAKMTAMENDRRMWKARAEASRDLLIAVLVEVPLAAILAKRGVNVDPEFLKRISRVEERNALLEKDAWTTAAQVAKEFVKAVPVKEIGMCSICKHEVGAFVRRWQERFKQALGEDEQETPNPG